LQPLLLPALLTGLVYFAAGLVLALGYFHSRRSWRRLAIGLAVLAFIGHAVTLWQAMNTPAGFDVSFLNTVSLAAGMIVGVLLASSLNSAILETGIIAFPGAGLFVWTQSLFTVEPLILGDLEPVLAVHVFSSILAYGLLGIAAINAVLLAIQGRLLRHPRPWRQLEMLPPLTVLESLMFRLIAAGWLVLTLSLATGLLFIQNLLAQHLAHKTILSLASWVLFGLLLTGRWWRGWRGRRAVGWTLTAMLILALAYFGSKLVLEVLLDRSWSTGTAALAAYGQ
jgi:ABC-type uncharacterized transport system permease subunit